MYKWKNLEIELELTLGPSMTSSLSKSVMLCYCFLLSEDCGQTGVRKKETMRSRYVYSGGRETAVVIQLYRVCIQRCISTLKTSTGLYGEYTPISGVPASISVKVTRGSTFEKPSQFLPTSSVHLYIYIHRYIDSI